MVWFRVRKGENQNWTKKPVISESWIGLGLFIGFCDGTSLANAINGIGYVGWDPTLSPVIDAHQGTVPISMFVWNGPMHGTDF